MCFKKSASVGLNKINTVHILPKTPHTLQNPHKHTHYKTHSYTHTLQNNIKPPQCKLQQNAYTINDMQSQKHT